MSYTRLAGETREVPSKYAGGRTEVRFSLWEKYGKSRLYYSFQHYDRHGRPTGHHEGRGYIDLESGEIVAPPSDRIMIRKLVEA